MNQNKPSADGIAQMPDDSITTEFTSDTSSAVIYFCRKVEAIIGAFLAFLIGFAFAVLGGDIAILSYRQVGFNFILPIYLSVLVAECAFLYFLKEALEKPSYPFAPWYAGTRIRWPILLRPVILLWWLAHLAVAVGGAVLLQYLLRSSVFPDQTPLAWFSIFAIVSFTAAYSVNLYILLALSALGFNQRVLLIVWRWRILVDLLIAAAAGWGVHHLLGKWA